MSNKQKAKIMSEDAFKDAVTPLITAAVAEGYQKGYMGKPMTQWLCMAHTMMPIIRKTT